MPGEAVNAVHSNRVSPLEKINGIEIIIGTDMPTPDYIGRINTYKEDKNMVYISLSYY